MFIFHWETGDYSVLLAKRKSLFANMGMCSAILVVMLRNSGGYYLWLRSITFLCFFPSGPIRVHNLVSLDKLAMSLVLIHLLYCSLFISFYACRCAQNSRDRCCCCHSKGKYLFSGFSAPALYLHMQFSHQLILSVIFHIPGCPLTDIFILSRPETKFLLGTQIRHLK